LPSDLRFSSALEPATPLVSTVPLSKEEPPPGPRYVTNRFNYFPHNKNDSYTHSHTRQKLYRCEDEPIHIPGAIQRFGALIAVREEAGFFLVRIVSENSQSVTRMEPEALFELRCFTDILTQADRKEFVIRAHTLYANTSRRTPDVFTISLTSLLGGPIPLFCAMHQNAESNLIICEFESAQRVINSDQLDNGGILDRPVQVVDNRATEAERILSITRRSQPLHTLEVARAISRQLTLMDLFQIHSEIQDQLSTSTELSNLLDVIVGLVQDLTGFHRVMWVIREKSFPPTLNLFMIFFCGNVSITRINLRREITNSPIT
jgi:light-regulated signal transduction histidine kinase (bacteriophytochrome)